MIPNITRAQLFNMTTSQLIDLDGQLTKLQERIKAELICRGDY